MPRTLTCTPSLLLDRRAGSSLSLQHTLNPTFCAKVMEDYGLEFLYNSGALLTRLIGDPPQVISSYEDPLKVRGPPSGSIPLNHAGLFGGGNSGLYLGPMGQV